jgi:hypothetical protein
MKEQSRTVRKCAGIFGAMCLGLFVLNGCQSMQDTQFSPVEVRLETLAGGVQTMVLVNSSGTALHNFNFRAYMWGDSPMTYTGYPPTSLPQRIPERTYTFQGSGVKWAPGEVLHFTDRNLGTEEKILRPVSRVQIAGSCDEGAFREDWQITSSGQLQQIGKPQ